MSVSTLHRIPRPFWDIKPTDKTNCTYLSVLIVHLLLQLNQTDAANIHADPLACSV